MTTKSYVGQQLTIAPGTKVRRQGSTATRTRETTVTIRKQEPARNGKTRVFWKSLGYAASALV